MHGGPVASRSGNVHFPRTIITRTELSELCASEVLTVSEGGAPSMASGRWHTRITFGIAAILAVHGQTLQNAGCAAETVWARSRLEPGEG